MLYRHPSVISHWWENLSVYSAHSSHFAFRRARAHPRERASERASEGGGGPLILHRRLAGRALSCFFNHFLFLLFSSLLEAPSTSFALWTTMPVKLGLIGVLNLERVAPSLPLKGRRANKCSCNLKECCLICAKARIDQTARRRKRKVHARNSLHSCAGWVNFVHFIAEKLLFSAEI